MIINNDKKNLAALTRYERIIQSLCGISDIIYEKDAIKPNQAAVAVVKDMEIFIPLGGLIDLKVEEDRLLKRKDEITRIIQNIQKKLNNQDFLTRAPEKVVQNERSKLEEIKKELEKVNMNLESMQ